MDLVRQGGRSTNTAVNLGKATLFDWTAKHVPKTRSRDFNKLGDQTICRVRLKNCGLDEAKITLGKYRKLCLARMGIEQAVVWVTEVGQSIVS